GHGLFGVVHVARPALHPQDVPSLGHVGQQRVVAGVLPMMGIEAAKGQPTVAPVRTTVPSTSIVRRGRARRLMASYTICSLSRTQGARVVWVNWRSQLPTVRAVGMRANPLNRAIRGSPPR